MKQLTLIRHAKSSWKYPELADRERPLNKRGERDAPAMGHRLARRGFSPELVLSSPAERVLTTAKTIMEAAGYSDDDIVVDERIYGASGSGLIAILRETDDALDRVVLFGHNPDLTWVINRLSTVALDNLPTCGIAHLTLPIERWAELGTAPAVDVEIDYPKKVS